MSRQTKNKIIKSRIKSLIVYKEDKRYEVEFLSTGSVAIAIGL